VSIVRGWLVAPVLGLAVCGILWLPGRLVAQAVAPGLADSAQVIATACAIVLALRPVTQRYRCQVVTYQETPTEYIVRLHEQPPPGLSRLMFDRSVVHLSKAEPSVTVSRVPEQ
jgi:hypothetical protein